MCQQHLVLSLTTARKLAARAFKRPSSDTRHSMTRKSQLRTQEESGALCKLSRPWHGPCQIEHCDGPNATVVKVYMYFLQYGRIQVHQTWIQHCPDIPAGFYWYGGKQSGPGRPAKWTSNMNGKKQQSRNGNSPSAKNSMETQKHQPKQSPPQNQQSPKALNWQEHIVTCHYSLQNQVASSGRASWEKGVIQCVGGRLIYIDWHATEFPLYSAFVIV